VSDLTIRPTAKFIIARFVATGIIYLALVVWWWISLKSDHRADLLPVIALVIFFPAFRRLVQRQITKVTLTGERLRYETGLISKTTRTIELTKLQDVTVVQRGMQRVFGVGDLSLETSGETSRLTIPDVDSPQTVADELLNRAKAIR
jgi:membrane protein YdbS with pleckstrin-like domain